MDPKVVRLDSWKAIAAFLSRDVSTARRWERESGLPVHRVPGNKRHAVYAYSDELDVWLRGRGHVLSALVSNQESPAAAPDKRVPPYRVGVLIGVVSLLTILGVYSVTRTSGMGTHLRADLSIEANTAAKEAYLRGRRYWESRTADGLRTAIEYFNQALEKNPRYSSAYAGLADSYTLLGLAGGGISAADVMSQAKAAAQRAIDLDSTSAEAHNSLAGVKSFYEWDWRGAEREFKRALELNSNYAPAHHWYGIIYLAALGQPRKAEAEVRRAYELDPTSAIFATDLGWAFYLQRRYDDAVAQYRKVLLQRPNFGVAMFRLSEVHLIKGMYEEAVTDYKDPFVAPTSVTKEYVPGSASEYRRQLHEQLEAWLKSSATIRVSPYYLACQYTRLGEASRAVDWLEKAYAEHEPALIYLNVDPLFDGLRSDVRFGKLLLKIGVVRNP